MNQLTVINRDGKFVIDSRDVAAMIEKEHKNLLRDIQGYEEILLSSNLSSVDFFIKSTYKDNTGRTLPCYLITRKGCDMVANKMTGEKGVLFTAAYVTKFEEMEKALQPQYHIPKTFAEALRLAADLEEQRQKLLPKAEQFDKFMNSSNCQDMNKVAKSLGTGRNRLFKFLRDKKILRQDNTPYQKYLDFKYFEVKEKPMQMGDEIINKVQTFVTPKGVEFISKMLSN